MEKNVLVLYIILLSYSTFIFIICCIIKNKFNETGNIVSKIDSIQIYSTIGKIIGYLVCILAFLGLIGSGKKNNLITILLGSSIILGIITLILSYKISDLKDVKETEMEYEFANLIMTVFAITGITTGLFVGFPLGKIFL